MSGSSFLITKGFFYALFTIVILMAWNNNNHLLPSLMVLRVNLVQLVGSCPGFFMWLQFTWCWSHLPYSRIWILGWGWDSWDSEHFFLSLWSLHVPSRIAPYGPEFLYDSSELQRLVSQKRLIEDSWSFLTESWKLLLPQSVHQISQKDFSRFKGRGHRFISW